MTDLKFNVAQLLREEIGARRVLDFAEPQLKLDESLILRDIVGDARFTRTASGIFASVRAQGVVRVTCVRSLEEFDYPVKVEFSDQFHSVVDVVNGSSLPVPAEEDPFMLDELHMVDLGAAIREYTLLELPLNPVSPAYRDQFVNYTIASDGLEADPVEAEDEAGSLEALKAWAERHNKRNSRS